MSILSSLFRNERAEKLERIAGDLNLNFSKKDEFSLVKKLGSFQLFQKGSSKRITNILSRDDGWLESRFDIFDYQYTIQHGKSSTTYKQTVFFMDSKKLGLPQFLMKPEHFFHRIGKYLNFVQDIEFEAHPEFSEKYLIQSEFPDMLKDMVPNEMAHFFTIEDKWSLEGLNYFLIFYRSHKRLAPETIADFYKKGMRIAKMLEVEEKS